ncbi:citrate synthase 1 [Mycobacteroides abscessus subsp. abscessus]|nr:citrate synthase 1 [Mycobacteroides abscessus subsp. abscessus]
METAVGALSERRKIVILGSCCLSLLIVSMDSTIVNVALPTIRADFGATTSQLQWVIDIYTLGLASLLMLSGAAGDRLGRRKVFHIGLSIFAIGSLLCSVAPTVGLLILHADHEQNCSSGGINALWGPLHGGANQAVLEMLERIRSEGGDTHDFVRRVKNREDGVKLMGFGHRVYKNYDPRARICKEQADKILGKLGGDDQLLEIAKALEEAALTDDYFVERKLYPNVDFYTGLIYRAIGFPTRMFTVLFALGRLPGWIAHWREMHSEPGKIGRPRQIYTGYGERQYP